MERGAFAAPAGDDEGFEGLELPLALVDGVLETFDALLVDVRLGEVVVHFLEVGRRQQRADAEQVALDGHQHLVDAGHRLDGARHSEHGVQLVDLAVGFDPRIVFGDAAATEETRVAGIASFCIDLHGTKSNRD